VNPRWRQYVPVGRRSRAELDIDVDLIAAAVRIAEGGRAGRRAEIFVRQSVRCGLWRGRCNHRRGGYQCRGLAGRNNLDLAGHILPAHTAVQLAVVRKLANLIEAVLEALALREQIGFEQLAVIRSGGMWRGDREE
jgi:Arc/MetJ family transcription regulator